MIEIEIDGKTLEVEQGSMIIEAADKVGIAIPRFCYHKKLSVAANCRMCLVDVEKAPKPLPACATPVTAGMKISTSSSKAKEAQRAVMEFLLINHPLDCPICDQGGQCELQDNSLEYGQDISRFTEGKRSFNDDDLGPLVATEMTRCIQCTRCVRFGQEIAGIKELGATGRGENMQITTYVKHSLQSELSGNIIDLCPVGALTSKPFRFKARAWELQRSASIAPHDCIGSNIFIHTRRQQVMRVVPRDNESINETWISDRDRFSYLANNSIDRLNKPMVKQNDVWQETDWETAFAIILSELKKVLVRYGAEQMAALASPNATIEELYLLQKLWRGLGCDHIDHRLHQSDFADDMHMPLYPSLNVAIEALESQDAILLIGANIQREQPLAAHRVRKATLRGSKVFGVNLVDYTFNFAQQEKIITAPQQLVTVVAGIAKALAELEAKQLSNVIVPFMQAVTVTAAEKAIAEGLKNNTKKLILLGAVAQNHPQASLLRMLAQVIAELCDAQVGLLTEGANSAGAWLAGAIPHRTAAGKKVANTGANAKEVMAQPKKAYFLLGIEPQLDCANPQQAIAALQQAEFVVALSPFKANIYLEHANVILPIGTFAETSGTYVNAEGGWQSVVAAAPAPGEARPAWKILRVLGNIFDLEDFNYESSEDVRNELRQLVDATAFVAETHVDVENINFDKAKITRITEWPLYSVDSMVRRAEALQQSASNELTGVYMNAELIEQLRLQEGARVTVAQGNGKAQLVVIMDARIPNNCVWIPAGREETANLGESFGALEIYA